MFISKEQWDENYERIFNGKAKKRKPEARKSGEANDSHGENPCG
jgi:hypothetical protein